ncbi:MAG: hypothetical protein RIQ60_1144 [Pseudomonadota bacterium]|jgi:hypothetical protein
MTHRTLKHRQDAQVARFGAALARPKRLELLDLQALAIRDGVSNWRVAGLLIVES